jgi:prophage regulatory protein
MKTPSGSKVIEPTPTKWEGNEGVVKHFDGVIFMRLPEVKAVTGLSKTSLYELIRAKDFPAPVRLAPRAVAWIKSEVKQWAEERILASRQRSEHPSGRRTAQRVPSETWAPPRKFA